MRKDHLIGTSLEWRVNTPALLKEIFDNNPKLGGIFYQPANIFRMLLIEVAERAIVINDPILNALMCRLSLYAESDPYDTANYNHDILMKTINSIEYLKYKKSKAKKTNS